MYFPYLRGKQFELIALREINGLMAENTAKISPIIEPVKNSSTLKKALLDFKTKNINFNIIINPQVGDLINAVKEILSILHSNLVDYTNYQIAIIIQENTKHEKIIELIKESQIVVGGISLIHNSVIDNISEIVSEYEKLFSVVNNIIDFNKTSRRYYRNFNPKTIVGLDDPFEAQQKNSDYLQTESSPFTEEHLFYAQDNFKGFSDYLTIGDKYSESGMLPFAVAIHLSYEDSKKIRIKHFVSNSNDDRADIAGKFAEALAKLISWCNKNNQTSIGITEFRELYTTGHFPGLGSIKKLSIMHHIELVLKLI
jgi:hypothetical protein